MKNITIIGAGWLGQPLATTLLSKGYRVFASKTSQANCQSLHQLGIKAFQCNLLHPKTLETDLIEQQPDIVIGCFPPGFRRGLTDEYQLMWKSITQAALNSKVKKIIMINSTAVYPSTLPDLALPELIMTEEKASYSLALENSQFTDNAKVLLRAEKHIIDSGIDFSILRFSGLIGPNRHPARFVSKLKQISQSAPANMLHLDDAIGSVIFAIEQLDNQIVNVTTPDVMSKQQFYQMALESANLPSSLLPSVVDLPDKKIETTKLVAAGYQYQYQTLKQALNAIQFDLPLV
ncbi:NAD(P)H-binding protein [Vibrio sp. ZSDE26]|uniref:NAD(P)H-binding protein n=1 Tax=Vibrio amylolyticus TaxID=2847292 RepID=A0A9X1XL42_9VIBR|nr:NAD(P)H-binding protein [Vibrio amylolyticus]MCK6262870.1 NAD(P)H-binding protein [Vibrio amylolyticus]